MKRFRIYLDETGDDHKVIKRIARIDITPSGSGYILRIHKNGKNPVLRGMSQHSVDMLISSITEGSFARSNDETTD